MNDSQNGSNDDFNNNEINPGGFHENGADESNYSSFSDIPQNYNDADSQDSVDYISSTQSFSDASLSPLNITNEQFNDETYFRLYKKSQIDSEYNTVINKIFDSADNSSGRIHEKNNKNDLYVNAGGKNSSPKKIVKDASDMFQDQEAAYREVSYTNIEQFSKLSKERIPSPPQPERAKKTTEAYINQTVMQQDSRIQSESPVRTADFSQQTDIRRQTAHVNANENPLSYDANQNSNIPPLPRANLKNRTIIIDENDDEVVVNYDDVRKQAQRDNIAVYFATGSRKIKMFPEMIFDKGLALFLSALSVLLISVLEAIPMFVFRNTLNLNIIYSIVMILIPSLLFLVFGFIHIFKFKARVRRNSSTRYITTASVTYVISVLAICASAIFFETDLKSVALWTHLIVPCVYSFNIVLFALFYLFYSKIKIKQNY